MRSRTPDASKAGNRNTSQTSKDADVLVLTEQTFSEFPDLFVTNAAMKEMRKVSDASPQEADLLANMISAYDGLRGGPGLPRQFQIELFLALRRLGKESYRFTYNSEPHGIRRRANQKDFAIGMAEYFDYELKGATKPAWMERGRPTKGRGWAKKRLFCETKNGRRFCATKPTGSAKADRRAIGRA